MQQPTAPPALECAVHSPPPKVHSKSEIRARIVVGITVVMMVVELVVGYLTNSLALFADGGHMATHVGALGLTAAAYWYARTRAAESRFAFGTGKVYALAGFVNGVALLLVAALFFFEGIMRFVHPEMVDFRDALPVAVLGLVVNFVSAMLLDVKEHKHTHDHGHDHSHHHHDEHEGHDHNLRAAYLHVLADAVTSVAAIVALLAGRYWSITWLDPMAVIVGGVLIFVWSIGLVRDSAAQLIDLGPSTMLRDTVKGALEKVGTSHVVDLHLWRVSPTQLACVATVATNEVHGLEEYKVAARKAAPIDHLTIELRPST